MEVGREAEQFVVLRYVVFPLRPLLIQDAADTQGGRTQSLHGLRSAGLKEEKNSWHVFLDLFYFTNIFLFP